MKELAMNEETPQLNIDAYNSGWDMTGELFKRYIVENRMGVLRTASWPCVAESLEAPLSFRHWYVSDSAQSAFALHDHNPVHLEIRDGNMRAQVGGDGVNDVEATIDALVELFPLATIAPGERRVPMYLWVMTPNGARKMRRVIDVPPWSDIEENYAAKTHSGMNELVSGRPESGKIILWHGSPGTGKSFALRSLAWEWREWCDIHYVVDPEVMFGDQASYLVNILFDDASVSDLKSSEDAKEEERWRLLVLEDTGEMLTMDAKEHVGQALSRLLNVTDGLLGQGLRVLILVTTNEELGRLHSAVARPGRCAAEIDFTALSKEEARDWMGKRDLPWIQINGSRTLAELYGFKEGDVPIPKSSAGFRISAE